MFTWIINIFKGKKNKLKSQHVITAVSDKVTENREAGPEAYISAVDRAKTKRKEVLKESSDKLNKLKIYVNYFSHPYITSIYNQSVIIHDIFDQKDELNINKLDQFHYYYTDHLIELLVKIKKSHDEHYSVVSAQINSYESKISTLKDYINDIVQNDVKDIGKTKSRYAQAMSIQLNCIYNCLVDKFDDFRFKTSNQFKNYAAFKNANLFYKLDSKIFTKAIEFEYGNNYSYRDYWIERKLMGKLQKNLFSITFKNVFTCGDLNFELFEISDINEHFIFIPSSGVFKFVEYKDLIPFMNDAHTTYGGYNTELETYTKKLTDLKIRKDDIRQFDSKTVTTLKAYMDKIEDVELIEKIQEIDLERQNLNSILELERLER